MKIVAMIARILLGLTFVFFGLNGFLNFLKAPMPTGLAGQFAGAIFASHFAWLPFGVQLVSGLLLLVNRYLGLALVGLAAEITNILMFHITMDPGGILPGIIAAILWCIVAFRARAVLLPLFTAKIANG